ncbi:hypothetical protein [Nocardia tengchongensis]|uniref:hypothetical protein n=1 Tax=Nocardia tengchongensis TaxID=2055889 RepID=UPI00368B6C1E
MQKTNRLVRRIACGAQGFAAITAIAMLAAPSASAMVTSIAFEPGVMDNIQVVTGKTFWFAVFTADFGSGSPTVQVYDNGQCIGSTIQGTGQQDPLQNYSYIYWQPSTAGTHTITAKQGMSSRSFTMTVLSAPSGSTPNPQPSNPSCGGAPSTGSFGS